MATKNYVDPLLTRISLGYKPLNYIGTRIMPEMPVAKATGKIANYAADNLRIVTSYKGDDAETATITQSTSISDGWVLEPHALKAFASDREADNEDKPFNVQRDRAVLVTDLLAQGREFSLANYMGTVGNFTNSATLSGTSQWGGSADDPIGDINTGIQTVADAIGVAEGMLTIVMNRAVFRKLRFLPEILESLGYVNRPVSSPGNVTKEDLASVFGVKEVIVGESYYNSAALGQTASLSPIWGKHCWIGHFPAPSGMMIQPFGYTCQMKAGRKVDKWYDTDRQGWWVRAQDEWDQLVLNEKAVYMIKDAIA